MQRIGEGIAAADLTGHIAAGEKARDLVLVPNLPGGNGTTDQEFGGALSGFALADGRVQQTLARGDGCADSSVPSSESRSVTVRCGE